MGTSGEDTECEGGEGSGYICLGHTSFYCAKQGPSKKQMAQEEKAHRGTRQRAVYNHKGKAKWNQGARDSQISQGASNSLQVVWQLPVGGKVKWREQFTHAGNPEGKAVGEGQPAGDC